MGRLAHRVPAGHTAGLPAGGAPSQSRYLSQMSEQYFSSLLRIGTPIVFKILLNFSGASRWSIYTYMYTYIFHSQLNGTVIFPMQNKDWDRMFPGRIFPVRNFIGLVFSLSRILPKFKGYLFSALGIRFLLASFLPFHVDP